MSRLTVEQQKRLYESLGTIAEALPAEYRRDLYRVCRWRADNFETGDTRYVRAVVRKHLPDTALDDWRWALAVLPDVGADDVLRRWANDAGLTRAPIET